MKKRMFEIVDLEALEVISGGDGIYNWDYFVAANSYRTIIGAFPFNHQNRLY